MSAFLLSFIPVFVAMDAFGVLPLFISFTEGLTASRRRKVLAQSIITAFLIGIIFLFLGKWILHSLGIMVSDFKVAGGLVLLAISLSDLLQYEKAGKPSRETMGAVPIGTPLITGPAVLTTIIILMDTHGMILTVFSFVVNLAIVFIAFSYATAISNYLGKAGSKAFSKIASLLLAAIAVMMIRKGVVDTIVYFAGSKI